MPEILHSKELDGDINIKKRLTKNLNKTYASDEPFGLTVPDAKSFDALLSATEEIDTTADLVVSVLNKKQSIPENVLASYDASKQIDEFFKSVRKGLNLAKSTKFKGLPRTDIEKISNYLPGFQEKLARFQTLFGDVKRRNAPKVNIPLNKLKTEEQQLKKQITDATQTLEEAEWNDQNGYGSAETDEIIQNYTEHIQKLKEDIALKSAQIAHMRKGSKLIYETKEFATKVAEVDYGLILTDFIEFIRLLSDGISSFNSGRTTQGNLGGSHLLGHNPADYMPRRFM